MAQKQLPETRVDLFYQSGEVAYSNIPGSVALYIKKHYETHPPYKGKLYTRLTTQCPDTSKTG